MSVSYLQAGVGPWMAEVVESPWFRGSVSRLPLEVRSHTIITRKLVYINGNGTLLSRMRQIYKQGRMVKKAILKKELATVACLSIRC